MDIYRAAQVSTKMDQIFRNHMLPTASSKSLLITSSRVAVGGGGMISDTQQLAHPDGIKPQR